MKLLSFFTPAIDSIINFLNSIKAPITLEQYDDDLDIFRDELDSDF